MIPLPSLAYSPCYWNTAAACLEGRREDGLLGRETFGNREKMKAHFVEYGSLEWKAARTLRHSMFYKDLGLPESIMDDDQEVKGSHLVALNSGKVIGYGRLNDVGDGNFHISQVVVSPDCQGKGIGSMLLDCLIERASSIGARSVWLSARLSASSFYERVGFRQEGEVFTSEKTGVPYIRMRLTIKNDIIK